MAPVRMSRSFDQREVADAQIGDIGDGVESPRRKNAGRDAQVTQTRSGRRTQRGVRSISGRRESTIVSPKSSFPRKARRTRSFEPLA